MKTLAIVLPIYNKDNPNNLKLCLKSLQNQTFRDFDIFAAIDGPISLDLEAVFEEFDNVIKITYNENRGLPFVLNDTIKNILNKGYMFIARMDADDISLPERIEKQLDYLLKNKNVDLVGSSAILINDKNEIIGKKIVPNIITFEGLLKNCNIIHPSVVFRSNFFANFGYYNTKFIKSQDYELWLRASNKGAIIHNIKEPLIKFRYDPNLIVRRKIEQKYNIEIKRMYQRGLILFLNTIKNRIIANTPELVLKLLLKILK